jgi:hypothetical protein
VKTLAYSSRSVTFPLGDYRIDNSGSTIVLDNFSGTLTMQPGARFVFTDNSQRGLFFKGGSGARFYGLRCTFQVEPPTRVSPNECVTIADATDTLVRDADIDGSAAAGLLFWRCIRPTVEGALIRNTRADGLHFANCLDGKADRITTENTGDDGLAFVNYADGPAHTGGLATNVTVRNSKARGIAVVGQRDVLVREFSVDGTSCPGVYCAYETFWNTRVPANVRFEEGTVKNAGRFPGQVANKFGMEYDKVESVALTNVTFDSPASRGVSGAAPNGTVRLSNVRVQGAPESGFDLRAKTLYLDGLTAEYTGGPGVVVLDSGAVEYGRLTAVNTSRTNTLRRAFWLENNGRVQGRELHVVDNQQAATGYVVAAYGPQQGGLGTVYDDVTSREVEIQNVSGLPVARGTSQPQPAQPRNTAPTITRMGPGPGTRTRDRTPRITATVRDSGTNLSKSNIRLYVDGRRVTRFSYNAATDRLTYVPRRLAPGYHRVRIVARDAQGLATTRTWVFRVV